MWQSSSLLPLARNLVSAVEALPPLAGLTQGADVDPRANVLLYLKGKVIPELSAGNGLPVFVSVQGGTNVGKSTVFNALAGKLLSPAIVQASATKHPLMYLHERWRDEMLGGRPFPDLECKELSDPKELIVDADRPDLLYFRFHDEDSLARIALIDSPDFDGALTNNLQVARRVTVLADVTLFVTSAQKYLDRELVSYLEVIRELKASVILIFNMVPEDIVFETLLDDLNSFLPLGGDGFRALRLPPSAANHPEDELRELLHAHVLAHLTGLDAAAVKPAIVGRTVRRLVGMVRDMAGHFAPEVQFKERLQAHLAEAFEREVDNYAAAFNLALPEETLAVRRLVRATEIGPSLELSDEVKGASTAFGLVSLSLRTFNDTLRRMLLRLSSNYEGSIDETARSVQEYAEARNEADFEQVLRRAESLRISSENFCRRQQERSSFAREILHSFFTPEHAITYADTVRRAFDQQEPATGGEGILERQEAWLEHHPVRKRALFIGANALKLGTGLLVAYVVPPAGILSILNWLYFAVGYFLAAYAVLLVLGLATRQKPRFRRARVSNARRVLDVSLKTPLEGTLERLLRADTLTRVEKIAAEMDAACASGAETSTVTKA